jgi:hypothetical protein
MYGMEGCPMSGLRYNEGKVPLNQLPASVMRDYMSANVDCPRWYYTVLGVIGDYQEGHTGLKFLIQHIPFEVMVGAAYVFEYGAQKYEQWNWTHGMKWSTVLGCMFRHMIATEESDAESKLPHEWHVACNVIMLFHYWERLKGENDIQFTTEDKK